jgi:hypothetical protein
MTDQWVDFIEWWETPSGEYNWHAKAANGEILFQSTQGYVDRNYMLSALAQQFPDVEVRGPE